MKRFLGLSLWLAATVAGGATRATSSPLQVSANGRALADTEARPLFV